MTMQLGGHFVNSQKSIFLYSANKDVSHDLPAPPPRFGRFPRPPLVPKAPRPHAPTQSRVRQRNERRQRDVRKPSRACAGVRKGRSDRSSHYAPQAGCFERSAARGEGGTARGIHQGAQLDGPRVHREGCRRAREDRSPRGSRSASPASRIGESGKGRMTPVEEKKIAQASKELVER